MLSPVCSIELRHTVRDEISPVRVNGDDGDGTGPEPHHLVMGIGVAEAGRTGAGRAHGRVHRDA